MNIITTPDNTELFVKDWGSGQPVILLSGWPLSSASWEDQAMVLVEAGYRVISYDRRGFGRSSQPWNGYDYDTLSDDLAAVIQQTGAVDVTLVGFSMGGGEVARYMSRHQGKSVVKTALISSVLPFMLKRSNNPDGEEQEMFNSMIEDIKADRAKFFAGFFKKFFGIGIIAQPVSDELMQWMQSIAMQASLRATIECVKSFSSTDFRDELSAFNVPTLIIHGTDDKTVPIEISSREAAQGIPQAKLIEYEGAPHGLFATDKDMLSRDLISFLKQ
ncbi:alpha/beta fold hydrolase [Iodobacter arcticus]|uniref:Alpha/beta fold hydrolase n=1 Tax=Iodobacter arcticus TaxID=590593 RepID=A0ABW2QS25_9NEIS